MARARSVKEDEDGPRLLEQEPFPGGITIAQGQDDRTKSRVGSRRDEGMNDSHARSVR